MIKSDGNIGGYSGATIGEKLRKKLRLLDEEGVKFDDAGNLLTHEVTYCFT